MQRIFLVPLLLAFFGGAAHAQEPIAIGISIAQSPPGSVVQGVQVKDGVEIIKDMINAKGGVLGRPIKLVYEDNQGIPGKREVCNGKVDCQRQGCCGDWRTSKLRMFGRNRSSASL